MNAGIRATIIEEIHSYRYNYDTHRVINTYIFENDIVGDDYSCHFTGGVVHCCNWHFTSNEVLLYMRSLDIFSGLNRYFNITLPILTHSRDAGFNLHTELNTGLNVLVRSFVFDGFALLFTRDHSHISTEFITVFGFLYGSNGWFLSHMQGERYMASKNLFFRMGSSNKGPLYAWEKGNKEDGIYKPLLRISRISDKIVIECKNILSNIIDIKWSFTTQDLCSSSNADYIRAQAVVVYDDLRIYTVRAKDILCIGYNQHREYYSCTGGYLNDSYILDGKSRMNIGDSIGSAISLNCFENGIVLFSHSVDKGKIFFWKAYWEDFFYNNSTHYGFVSDAFVLKGNGDAIKPKFFKSDFFPVDILKISDGPFVIFSMKQECMLNSVSNTCAVSVLTIDKYGSLVGKEVLVSQFMNYSNKTIIEENFITDIIFSLITDAVKQHGGFVHNAILRDDEINVLANKDTNLEDLKSQSDNSTLGGKEVFGSIGDVTQIYYGNNTIISNNSSYNSTLKSKNISINDIEAPTIKVFFVLIPVVGFVLLLLFLFFSYRKHSFMHAYDTCFSKKSKKHSNTVLLEEGIEVNNLINEPYLSAIRGQKLGDKEVLLDSVSKI